MTSLVTGATGFIGRFLVPALLRRGDTVHVLVPPDERGRYDTCARDWAGGERVRPVEADLDRVDPAWVRAHRGDIEHVFHLDPAAGAAHHAIALAAGLDAARLHHVSTVEISGDHHGAFTEDMFDVGQTLRPAQRVHLDAERAVRAGGLDWRIYRPAIVIGHSRTGEIDRAGSAQRFFRMLRMAAQLPRLLPVLVPRLGETNMVPVDFVVAALDHLAHAPGGRHTTFHLVDPVRTRAVDALNLFADEAGAPHLVEVMPKDTLRAVLRLPGAQRMLPSVGIDPAVLEHNEFGCWFDRANTTAGLAGTDITVPPLADYAPRIWKYWTENGA